jgi:phosphatidylinositol glycan class S
LSSLLTRISNMVIEDDIAEKVKQSVDAIQKSLISLKEGNMTEAFHASKTAFVMSEKAFFDKSLLEKLYFPEDQR